MKYRTTSSIIIYEGEIKIGMSFPQINLIESELSKPPNPIGLSILSINNCKIYGFGKINKKLHIGIETIYDKFLWEYDKIMFFINKKEKI